MHGVMSAAAAVLAIGGSAMAQQGVKWNFAGLTGAPVSVGVDAALPVNASDPLVGAVSPIVRGAGLSAASGTGVFNAGGFNTGVTLNYANNDYFEFTYTAPAQGGVRLGGLTHQLQRQGAPQSTQTRWHVSLTGVFTANVNTLFPTGHALGSSQSAPSSTAAYGGSASFSAGLRVNDGQTVTFRLYGWNGANGGLSLNDAALRTTSAYTNSLAERVWDRGVNPGSTSVNAGPYSYYNYDAALAQLGPGSTLNASFEITAQSGPSVLVAGTDYTFDSSTRVLTMLDTSNVLLGTYAFDYSLITSGVQDGVPFGPSVNDTGTITVTVVPAPAAGLVFVGGLAGVARRRRR